MAFAYLYLRFGDMNCVFKYKSEHHYTLGLKTRETFHRGEHIELLEQKKRLNAKQKISLYCFYRDGLFSANARIKVDH